MRTSPTPSGPALHTHAMRALFKHPQSQGVRLTGSAASGSVDVGCSQDGRRSPWTAPHLCCTMWRSFSVSALLFQLTMGAHLKTNSAILCVYDPGRCTWMPLCRPFMHGRWEPITKTLILISQAKNSRMHSTEFSWGSSAKLSSRLLSQLGCSPACFPPLPWFPPLNSPSASSGSLF